MKLHYSLIDKLLRIYAAYGGHREEVRLKQELQKLEIEQYQRQDGTSILVDREELQKAMIEPKQ